MAEGWARYFATNDFGVQSAGIEAHGKNPRAMTVMSELEIDISNQESTRLTQEMLEWAHLVVTVCGHADENCPALPVGTRKQHWPLDDPAKATGSPDEVLKVFRACRDDIKHRVQQLITRMREKAQDERLI